MRTISWGRLIILCSEAYLEGLFGEAGGGDDEGAGGVAEDVAGCDGVGKCGEGWIGRVGEINDV